jgi:hypothetical protein
MIVTNFDILEVRLGKLDAKTQIAKVKVICSDDETPLYLDMDLSKGMEWCAKELIRQVKEKKKKEDPTRRGPLGNLSIVNVLNDEEVVEGVYKGLVRVDSKVSNLNRIRVASEYMKLFDQVNTLQETLYRKRRGE